MSDDNDRNGEGAQNPGPGDAASDARDASAAQNQRVGDGVSPASSAQSSGPEKAGTSAAEQLKQAAMQAGQDERSAAVPTEPPVATRRGSSARPPSDAAQVTASHVAAAPVQVAVSRSSATPIAWLAIVLALVVAVGVFYMMLELQRREAALLQRVQGLESLSGQDDTAFEQMGDNLRRQIELEIEGMQARQQRAETDLERGLQSQQQELARLQSQPQPQPPSQSENSSIDLRATVAQELAPLERSMAEQEQAVREQQQTLREQQQSLLEQQQRINDLTVEDKSSWQLAEAQYLLRLANQRLIMTGDTVSAEALLRSADNLMRLLDDADLHDLRSAVAADLAAVRAVPKLDIEGLYLRLDALIRQTDALVMFKLPERESGPSVPLEGDWTTRLTQGYDVALEKLSEYIVVSRRDVPVEALMDPQYEGLVRQNMRMLLEQGQVAMLSGNERLFRQSLERASGWVAQFFKSDEQAAIAMSEELAAIRDEQVSVDLPDLTASLQALDVVMRARLARSGN